MKQKFLVILSIIFTLSATSLVIIQVYQTRQSAAISDNMFNINVSNAMDATISQLNENFKNNASYSIDYHTLDSLITDELLVNGIDFTPYVGIVNASMDEFLYCSVAGKEGLLLDSPFKFSFTPPTFNDTESIYIVLAFSSAALFLLQSTRIYVYMSIFLILIIFISFSLTLKIILNQRKLDEMKTDFISNMTHEIKTPIATIRLACEMLMDNTISNDSNTRNNFINIINDENRRMQVLIETILQNAKMSNKNFSISRKEINLNDTINEVVKGFSISIANRRGVIDTHLLSSPSTIFADGLHITNLIYNLIDNAIKYSIDSPRINITTEDTADYVVLRIADHGIGISKEDQKHIFEKFYRVSTGNIHNVKGFGIGLNYVSQVVSLHQGKIAIESELGKGSTFIISLPKGSIA